MKKSNTFSFLLTLPFLLMAGSPSLLAADAAAGKKQFKKCKACHSVKDGDNKIGPTLYKIVGRASAAISGFEYSDGMKALGITWDEASLDKWIKKPKAMVKGTKMIFPGLKKADKRADLIEYLKTLK